ncbi:hypothetical protein M1N56_06300 [Dehalococcoidia bacterium]|nr:hypothetical protein [Dehalococcoidia bacterium]
MAKSSTVMSDWISATATRNFAASEPLLDWLDLYGKAKGFRRDEDYDDYDERTDFSLFIMQKGIEFEAAVAKHLSTILPMQTVLEEGNRGSDLEVSEKTVTAMESGTPLVYQAILRHDESRTYGIADFLIRSDKLRELFPGSISEEEATVGAPLIGGNPWHYRVIDAKFTTLHFRAGGDLSPSGSAWGYMLQVYIYNRALGAIQGHTPSGGYLLGRKWEQTIKREQFRSNSCMDRLGFVSADTFSKSKGLLSQSVEDACNWIRRARNDGQSWNVTLEPSIPELRPNMGSTSDQPWHHAKGEINRELRDLTGLWQVGVEKRNAANAAGIFRWDEKEYSPGDVGVKGVKTGPTLQKIIEINRNPSTQPILPSKLKESDQGWRIETPVEFYVDFETVSDLDDDFSSIPLSGGQPLIFMIGCGHMESGEWNWSCFTADALTEDSEAEIIDQWIDHMDRVQLELGNDRDEPLVLHWSHAEQSTFETAFNSATERHPEKEWRRPNWYDFLKKVVREEPLTIRGSFGFGLKSVAGSMRTLGAIETAWDAGPTDGLGAMVGAWVGASEAAETGTSMRDIELVNEISQYNEVDCKVMMEIVAYLRKNH